MSVVVLVAVHAGLGITLAVLDRFFSGQGARLKTSTWIIGRGHDRKLVAAILVELALLVGACHAGATQVASALVLLIPQAIVLVVGIDLAELGINAYDRARARRRRRRVEVLAPADRPLLSGAGFEETLGGEASEERGSELDERLRDY